ncbi:MAG TPA: hypothetical protein VFO16_01520 [Pseudonocardiaceae bacterium]|nr:hypothetical protein [Pseudonocardiaceae bacterium]
MATYKYSITGRGGDGSSWSVDDTLTTQQEGSFPSAVVSAIQASFEKLQASFDKLTLGKVVYEHPGEGGCRGPYTITRMTIERMEH